MIHFTKVTHLLYKKKNYDSKFSINLNNYDG